MWMKPVTVTWGRSVPILCHGDMFIMKTWNACRKWINDQITSSDRSGGICSFEQWQMLGKIW
jgi:hypothetical protein